MNKRPLKIGITGGIGVGKSVVARIIATLGIPVYDADTQAKYLMNNDPELIGQIKAQFGDEAYTMSGLNTAYLSSRVFNNPEKLQLLNSLVHPQVGKDFSNWYESVKDAPYIVKEAALLFEAGTHADLDKIIVVSAPLEIRINRVLKRDIHRTREQILAIIHKQMPDEEKIRRADFVVVNDGENLLIPQILPIHHQLLELTRL